MLIALDSDEARKAVAIRDPRINKAAKPSLDWLNFVSRASRRLRHSRTGLKAYPVTSKDRNVRENKRIQGSNLHNALYNKTNRVFS